MLSPTTFGGDPGDAAGDLADRLDAWTAALGCELCLVLDQFEELFLYHEEGGLLEAAARARDAARACA